MFVNLSKKTFSKKTFQLSHSLILFQHQKYTISMRKYEWRNGNISQNNKIIKIIWRLKWKHISINRRTNFQPTNNKKWTPNKNHQIVLTYIAAMKEKVAKVLKYYIMLPSKWENLSHFSTKLIHVCKKLPLALDCRQSKYSQQIFNIHVFPFWVWLLQLLSYVFSKSSSFLLQKSFKLIFAALHLSTH